MAIMGHDGKRSSKKPHKGQRNGHAKPSATSDSSFAVNPLKSKIRDITRALEHSDRLPPGVRIEKERALVGYKQDLEKAERTKNKQQMIKKYHMVRFFERQKATRNLRKAKSRLQASQANSTDYLDLQNSLHEAEVDLNYTLYHPLDQKYISLFARLPKSQSGSFKKEEARPKKPPLWEAVEASMQKGTLEKLRDGKVTTRPLSNMEQHQAGDLAMLPQKTLKKQEDDTRNVTEESDDGFFEE